MRGILAGLAGAAVSAGLALLLGEYPFTGFTILAAGVVFGLFVAEAVVSVGHDQGGFVPAECGLLAGLGMTWAGWISTGRDLGRLSGVGWGAVAVAVAAAGFRARKPGRAADSRPAPSGTD